MESNENIKIHPQELEKILEEIHEVSENDPISVFQSFSSTQWADWLDDIINVGFANPVSFVSRGDDIIVEIVDFLRANSIKQSNYESSLLHYVSQYDFEHGDYISLERVLNALINLRSYSDHLMKIVVSRENSFLRGNNNYIKSLALLSLARAGTIDQNIIDETYNYIRMVGLKDMTHDPVFFGNSLRFVFAHCPSRYFELLTYILDILENDVNVNSNKDLLLDRHVRVLVDKLEELHYEGIGRFYSELFNWLINMLAKDHFHEKRVFNTTMSELLTCMDLYPFQEDMLEIDSEEYGLNDESKIFFEEYEYAIASKIILAIRLRRENNKPSHYHLLHSIAFISTYEKKYNSHLRRLLFGSSFYLRKNYDVLPGIAHLLLANEFDNPTIKHIKEMLNDAIFSHRITISEQQSLNPVMCNFLESLVKDKDVAIEKILSYERSIENI